MRLNPLKIGSTFGHEQSRFYYDEILGLNPLKIGSTFGPVSQTFELHGDKSLNPLKIGSTFGRTYGADKGLWELVLIPSRSGLRSDNKNYDGLADKYAS